MSLREPQLKMSKSHADPRSRILLTDSDHEIGAKVGLAKTDSEPGITYNPEERPGVSNLLDIMHHLSGGDSTLEALASSHDHRSMREFKQRVTDVIIAHIAPIRENYQRMIAKDEYLDEMVRYGAQKAHENVKERLLQIYERVGLK